MKEDQERWDRKYREKRFDPDPQVNSLLRKHIRLFPRGRALDLAAGEGRNAVFLAEHGFRVEAVDISRVALSRAKKLAKAKGVPIRTMAADLDGYAIAPGGYDLILNFYFLDRRLIPGIKRGLRKGGMAVFESYTRNQRSLGTGGPADPKYLLRPNELLRLFRGLHVVFYREGIFREGGRKQAVASIIAQKK